jgi:hypothetical protein
VSKDPVVEPLDHRLVVYMPRWALFARFKLTMDDPALPGIVSVEVDATGDKPVCRSLTVTARGNGTVDGGTLRQVPVARLLDKVVALAVMREEQPGAYNLFKSSADFRAFQSLRSEHPRERWALTAEHLAEVADVYTKATRAPVKAVAAHWRRPRATASRWISKARQEGHFDQKPPAKPARKKGSK